jgi:hypothetical protein
MNIVCEVCGDILYGDGQDGETTTGEMCQQCQQIYHDKMIKMTVFGENDSIKVIKRKKDESNSL